MGFYEDHINKQLQETEQSQRIYEETKQALRTEERFVNFFKAYNPQSVEIFIDFYAQMKVTWHRYSGNFEKYAAQRLENERHHVVRLLEDVMLKKLFNLKCRWAAGEMDIEGVEISEDFSNWKRNPALLKAVGPIGPDEFYCYLDYFKEGSPERLDEHGCEEGSAYGAFISYHTFRSVYAENPEEPIPEWFHRYDRHFGTAYLLHLPTIRTDIEHEHLDQWRTLIQYPSLGEPLNNYYVPDLATKKRMHEDPEYRKHWMEESHRQYNERQASMPQYENFNIYNREIMEEIVRTIEPREVQRMYHDARKWTDLNDQDEGLFTPLDHLKSVEEHVAVSPNDDYREAIKEAYEQHSRQTDCEALEMLFEEYETCQRSGQPFDWGNSRNSGAAETRRRILALRELKGLPLNFEFLQKKNLP